MNDTQRKQLLADGRVEIESFNGHLYSNDALMQLDRDWTRKMVEDFHGGKVATMEGFVGMKHDPFRGAVGYIDDRTGKGYVIDYEWTRANEHFGRIASVSIERDPSYDADPVEQAPQEEDEQGWHNDFNLVVNFVRELAEAAERGETSAADVQAHAYGRVYAFMKGIAGERGITLPEIQKPESNN